MISRHLGRLGACLTAVVALSSLVLWPAAAYAASAAPGVHPAVVDGTWACSVPAGYTYSYHLRVPVNGLWACTVPPGWGYSATSYRLAICDPSNFTYSYLLAG